MSRTLIDHDFIVLLQHLGSLEYAISKIKLARIIEILTRNPCADDHRTMHFGFELEAHHLRKKQRILVDLEIPQVYKLLPHRLTIANRMPALAQRLHQAEGRSGFSDVLTGRCHIDAVCHSLTVLLPWITSNIRGEIRRRMIKKGETQALVGSGGGQ